MKISNFKLAIGVPCSFPFIPASFFYSFTLMEKPDFIFIHTDNGPIDTLRNDIVEKALLDGATHLIMMDVDQVYPVDVITRLIKHKLPVVGCRVHRRYPPFDPIMLELTDTGYHSVGGWEKGDLVEVDATGTGCVMFDTSVFKRIEYPWFRFQKDPDTGLTIGEDIGFCQDLKKAGYKIFVDTGIECGHLTTMVVNGATHELYKSVKGTEKALLG